MPSNTPSPYSSPWSKTLTAASPDGPNRPPAYTIASLIGLVPFRVEWAIMPRLVRMQQHQSVIGLFRALKVEPSAVPRTRPFYRRLVDLVDRGVARHELPAGFQLPPERDLAR